MNTDGPYYEIIPAAEIPKKTRQDKRVARTWVPLRPDEEEILRPMSAEDRAAWLRLNMPTKERLARWFESEEAPAWIVHNARTGLYDDFDDNGHETPQIKCVADLRKVGRFDLCAAIIEGDFDAPKNESDAWAERQTGEAAQVLDMLKLRQNAAGN